LAIFEQECRKYCRITWPRSLLDRGKWISLEAFNGIWHNNKLIRIFST